MSVQPKSVTDPKEIAKERVNTIAQTIFDSLDEDKAEELVKIDLEGKSSVADHMIIASGRSNRHVSALADHVLRKLKELNAGQVKVEGLPHADWVLIDTGDVIVHIFRPDVRDFYNLEKLWAEDSAHRRQPEVPAFEYGMQG